MVPEVDVDGSLTDSGTSVEAISLCASVPEIVTGSWELAPSFFAFWSTAAPTSSLSSSEAILAASADDGVNIVGVVNDNNFQVDCSSSTSPSECVTTERLVVAVVTSFFVCFS